MFLNFLFEFNLKSSLLLIFLLHGLLFTILLMRKWIISHENANFWLAAFTFLSTLYISPFVLGYAGWYSRNPYREIMFYIPFQHLYLIPPVLFFYLKSLLDKSFRFSGKDFLHFIPGAIYLVYALIVFVTDKLIMHESIFYTDGRDKDFSEWYQLTGFVFLLAYTVASLKIYRQYKRNIFDFSSFAESVLFNWVRLFLISLLFLLVLRVLFFIINPEWFEFGRKFWYYACYSLLLYFISFNGYLNTIRSSVSFRDFDIAKPNTAPEAVTTSEEVYESILDEDIEPWKLRIELLVKEKRIYENPALTLNDLSSELGITTKKVSQVINRGFEMNFNDFINRARVLNVIEKLQSGEHGQQNLMGIAYDAGFNSKSTFNRAFKKNTGLTPKEFITKNKL